MTRSRSTVDQLLAELRRELRPLGRRRRRRVLAEVRDHMLSAVEDGQSESDVVRRLGDANGALAGFPARRKTHRAALIAVPVAFLALAAPVSGPLVRNLGAGATPSQAATISPARQQRLAQEACVRAWNSVGNARWRVLARRSHAAQAYVAVGYQTRRLPVTDTGTPVSLVRDLHSSSPGAVCGSCSLVSPRPINEVSQSSPTRSPAPSASTARSGCARARLLPPRTRPSTPQDD